MKISGFLIFLILAFTILLCPQSQNNLQMDELITMAKEFVTALETGKYADSVEHFDETMTKLVPPDKMKAVWEAVTKQVGQFKQQKSVWTESIPKYDIVYVTCEFEKATLDIKVVFDKNKKIAGQFFVPPKPLKEYVTPEYADKDSFSEQEVKIGVQGWRLPGTLSIPSGNGPFPALVLVHGSGPNDRDESLGPNECFKDLAWGLASQNIAVLRYDKRTKVHGQKMLSDQNEKLTVYEETIEDALSAVDLLRKTERIDAKNIFILGHSLGGMLIPRMAKADGETINGFIIMAGPTRPLEELIVDQVEYISLLDGKISEEEKANLDQLKAVVQKIQELKLSNVSEVKGKFLGAGANYWLDLKGYDPAEKTKSIDRPLLILQGGRDYQVTTEDFEGWKKTLSDKNTVEFILYADLNHLLIPGKGKCTPSEYQEAGHVDKAVIDDIVEWMGKVKK
jgi:fermentation-respiration switch protein FrsA (DUF1100 family)